MLRAELREDALGLGSHRRAGERDRRGRDARRSEVDRHDLPALLDELVHDRLAELTGATVD